jgi:hypothetical protein
LSCGLRSPPCSVGHSRKRNARRKTLPTGARTVVSVETRQFYSPSSSFS